MSSVNINIVGNLTRDPEIRDVGGQNVCHFSVAARTPEKDAEGNYITNYFDCSIWGKRAESFVARAQKGSLVHVAGTPAVVPYQANDGSTKYSIRVRADSVEVESRAKGEANRGDEAPPLRRRSPNSAPMPGANDIPF